MAEETIKQISVGSFSLKNMKDAVHISVFKNTGAVGQQLYQDMINAVPFLGSTSGAESASQIDKMKTAMESFTKEVQKAFSATNNNLDKETAIDTFMFPLPTSITEHYTQAYEMSEYNLDNRIMASGANKALDWFGSKISQGGGGAIEDIISMTQHLGRRGNASVNPNTLNVYIGSKPRIFTLNFQIIPADENIAEAVMQSVSDLTIYSRGTRSAVKVTERMDVGIIKSSHLCTFNFKMLDESGESYIDNPYMNTMIQTDRKSCGFYITNIDVDLGGAGDSIQYFNNRDKSGKMNPVPKMINISMTLLEQRPKYNADWLESTLKKKGAK